MIKLLYIIFILIASFILVKGADLMIKSLRKVGKRFNWSPFLLSFVFIAISTSLPEIFVGITSAINKVPQLSLGNIIGANIINLTLVLGLCAVIAKNIKFKKTARIETIFSLLIGFCPVLLALDGMISQIDGFVLIFLFIIYVISIFLFENKNCTNNVNETSKNILMDLFRLIIGLILLVGSAELIIKLSQELAIILELPLILIGLILVSLGTTLPELTFSLRAAFKEQSELSLGNSLGSIVANSCLALGLAAIIFPIKILAFSNFLMAASFFLLTIIIFIIFIRTREKLSRIEGIFLVLFFIIFLVIQFLIN